MSKNRKNQPKGRRAPKKSKTGMIVGLGGGAVAVIIALMVVLGGSAQTATAAPAWEAQSIDGEKLSALGFQGDVYVVDFFFTWCPICAQQFPHKKALVDYFAEREDFHFISISVDPGDTPAKLDQYRTAKGANWPFVSDKFGLLEDFKPNSRPFIVFVDRDGNIQRTITRITPADTLIEIAQDLLDKPVTSPEGNTAAQAFAPLLAIPTVASRRPRLA